MSSAHFRSDRGSQVGGYSPSSFPWRHQLIRTLYSHQRLAVDRLLQASIALPVPWLSFSDYSNQCETTSLEAIERTAIIGDEEWELLKIHTMPEAIWRIVELLSNHLKDSHRVLKDCHRRLNDTGESSWTFQTKSLSGSPWIVWSTRRPSSS